MKNKPITLTEFCGLPPDSFDKYLQEKSEQLRKDDETIQDRIRKAHLK